MDAYPITWTTRTLSGGNRGAVETLRVVKKLAHADAKHLEVRQLAASMVYELQPYDFPAEIEAVFAFVRDAVRYLGDIRGVETVQYPRYTLRSMQGDCDDMAALLASLLLSIGHRVRFVLVKTNARQRSRYSHILVEAWCRGLWVSLDPTIPGAAVGMRPTGLGPDYREG